MQALKKATKTIVSKIDCTVGSFKKFLKKFFIVLVVDKVRRQNEFLFLILFAA